MTGVQVKINRKGAAQILKSTSVQAAAKHRAQQIATAAGPGYKADSMIGRNRARASVYADTFRARRDNARRGTLLRSVGAARRG